MARKPKSTSVDMTLITKERAAEIREEARLKVQAKKTLAAEEELLRQEVEAAEREGDPTYEQRTILIDCAAHSPGPMIDGKLYAHGQSYTVDAPVYAMLIDMVERTWQHEREIGGANRRAYVPPPRNQMISAGNGRAQF